MKEKSHELIDAVYFPPNIIKLQQELLHPYHSTLYIKIHLEYPEAISEATDVFDFLAIVAAAVGIQLDGEYKPDDLALMIYNRIRNERRAGESIIINSAQVKDQ